MAARTKVKPAEEVEAEADSSEDDEELAAQVVEMKDEQGLKWAEIAEQLEIGQGKATVLYFKATLDPKDKVSWKNEEDLAEKIVALRDEDSISWGIIAIRVGVPETKVRKMYTDTTGVDNKGLRIGKGGRHPKGEENGNGSTATTPRSAKQKASDGEASGAAETVALPNPRETPYSDWTLAQLKTRFNGKKVTYQNSAGKIERCQVKTVRKIVDGEMTFADIDDKARTIVTTSIKSVSR